MDETMDYGAIPKALQASVKRFGGMRRRVRLTLTSSSTTTGANNILRVRLPTNSLVDLRTFGFNGDWALAADHFVAGTHNLIRRIGLVAGGVNVNFQNNVWNQTAHAMNLASQGIQWDESNVMTGTYPKDMIANGDFAEFNYFPLSPMTCGIIDTGLTGECEVDIVFDGNLPCITKQGVARSATAWSLSSVRAYVDVIDLESDFYRKFAASALSKGKTMVKAMELATAVIQTGTGSNNFNVSTGCLDKVLVGVKPATYDVDASGVQIGGQVYNTYLDFNCGVAHPAANASIYAQIGSTSFPAYGFGRNFAELASLTRNNWAGSSYNYNKLFLQSSNDASGITIAGTTLDYNAAAFCSHNAVLLLPVGAFDEYGKLGGIDLSSGNSVIRIEQTGLGAGSNLLMAGVHKSLLQVQSGQVVSYSN